MSKKLVLFGAGNIGRSFIAAVFSRAGYETVFVDVNKPLVAALNAKHEYRVIVKHPDGHDETIVVKNVRAVDGNDTQRVADELADASIAATAVGKDALKYIIPNLAEGIKRRSDKALDVILAENARNAVTLCREMLEKVLGDTTKRVGLVATSIGKMVPIMKDEDVKTDPLWVFAEPYNTLIVDAKGFLNKIPDVPDLKPVENIDAYVDRKLFVHNLGHAAAAYFGFQADKKAVLIADVLKDESVTRRVRECMLEASNALVKEYSETLTMQELTAHIDDLISRFRNRSLGDTVFRVGRDLMRKLKKDDRIVGAMILAEKHGLKYRTIMDVFFAALSFRAADEHGALFPADALFHSEFRTRGTRAVLTDVCGLCYTQIYEGRVIQRIMNSPENEIDSVVEKLNSAKKNERLKNAAVFGKCIRQNKVSVTRTEEVNNHVHTSYSFSPYHPTMAAYAAQRAGLQAVGIMDHDSVGGCEEMIAAASSFGIASTCGFELRVNFSKTAIEGRKINNPDSKNIGYIAIHGIPRKHIKKAAKFLKPIQAARNERNRAQVKAMNRLIERYGLAPVDYERDVFNASEAKHGGAITERHILAALARTLIAKNGKGPALVSFVECVMEILLPKKIEAYLCDPKNPHYMYDLLGVLKSSFLDKIFIQPNEKECISVFDAVAFGNSINAIPVYAYLGDVGESPTGDKKAEHFEDAYLDELMDEIKRIGFKGITYMPPRNTREQIARLQALAAKHGFMEISGVDINSSRQSFNCPIILEPSFTHLITATWALIAHEKLASVDERFALFHPENPLARAALVDRIRRYAEAGRSINPNDPYNVRSIIKSISSTSSGKE
ncbi:MAG: hypothetical protein HZC28_12445 [Spirochaetes bacterium]|nr:hypothetical protein [Spirochaetota bacterium]